MFVSQTVMQFLDRSDVDFEVVSHRHTATSSQTARAAGINPNDLAKAVLLQDDEEYLMAVLPAPRMVNPWAVEALIDEPNIVLAQERDLPFIFRDCERGAIPVLGPAFGLRTVVDDAVLQRREVFFEGGDHEHLVHIHGADFARLFDGLEHGHIAF